MEIQEQECFLERTRLERHQLDSLNLSRTIPPLDVLEPYDALFIGGAGEYSATDDYDWTLSMLELVRKAYREKFPTFGSCWGHQIIARALGGDVIHDPSLAEMGCLPVILTEAGKKDRLFGAYPETFLANMGHHDRIRTLPPGGIDLAGSETQPYEAFRMADSPMFGTQFHSELDAHRERERIIRYRPFYLTVMPNEEAFQTILDSLAETTEVDHLMHEFIMKFVVNTAADTDLDDTTDTAADAATDPEA
jgi:GMP synthase (glutamine-hydrolysing)